MTYNHRFMCVFAIAATLTIGGCWQPVQPVQPGQTGQVGQPDGGSINTDTAESLLSNSLVYLEISAYSYEQFQPWKPADIVQRSGFGTAVGPYSVLTTAWNVADATMIKIRRHGKNEFITATVKVVDYQSNLSLLELDEASAGRALEPVVFSNEFERGAELAASWLDSNGDVKTGRGYMDRVEVHQSTVSYSMLLNYIVGNSPKASGRGRLYTINSKPTGIACWANNENSEAGLIPAETINKFLQDAAGQSYAGFGAVGFRTTSLLDPSMRRHLKIPADITGGIYVAKVHQLGTGSDVLKANDVILAIEGRELDANGRFDDKRYGNLLHDHLITGRSVGEDIAFDLWRDGKRVQLTAQANNFTAKQMLIPYYEFGNGPEYIVTGGFVIQALTRPYMSMWGDDWSGKVPPHLYQYYLEMMFDPSQQRSKIVILSYVLPHEINLGYHGLGRMVITKFNGQSIGTLSDIIAAQRLNPDAKFDVIEFEQDSPTVVIPRGKLQEADAQIAQRYGIKQLVKIDQ